MKITSLTLTAALCVISGLQAQTTPPANPVVKPAVVLPPQAPEIAAQKFGPDGKVNAGFILKT